VRENGRKHCFAAASIIALTLTGCGNERGGDHVPEFKTYRLPTLPPGSDKSGVSYHAVKSPAVRDVVHLDEVYDICVSSDFDQSELSQISALIKARSGTVGHSGLERVINHALENVSKFSPKYKNQLPRVEFQLVSHDASNTCDLLVVAASAAEFPFSDPDFSEESEALFYKGQMQASDGQINEANLAFVRSDLTGEALAITVQRLIGYYLGFNASSLDNSFLNPKTSALAAAEWFVVINDEDSKSLDDAKTVYTFAGLYADILRPDDLATFHHYGDRGGADEQDDQLPAFNLASPYEYKNLYGQRCIDGVRRTEQPIHTCVHIASGVSVTTEEVAGLFAFSQADATARLGGILKQTSSDLNASLVTASSGCHLVVALRQQTQFPFTKYKLNGAYFPESTLKDAAGNLVSVPVIYLNGDNLAYKEEASSKKSASAVLEHEIAHYLGLRHQDSDGSILSPGGYYSEWSTQDRAALKDFAEQHQKLWP
jgi:hypothetical protein